MSLRASLSRILLAAAFAGCGAVPPPATDPTLSQEYAAGQEPPVPLPRRVPPDELPCEELAPRADAYGNNITIAAGDHWAWPAFVRCFPNARIVNVELADPPSKPGEPPAGLDALASLSSMEWLTVKIGRDTSCTAFAALPVLPSVKHVVFIGACSAAADPSTASRLLTALPSVETVESQSADGQVHFHASAKKIVEMAMLDGRGTLFDVALARFKAPERVITIGPLDLARIADTSRLKELQATAATLGTLTDAPLESVTLLPSADTALLSIDTLARFPLLRRLVVMGDITASSITRPLPVEELETDRTFDLSVLGLFPKLKKLTAHGIQPGVSPVARTKPLLELVHVRGHMAHFGFLQWMPPAEEVHLHLGPVADLSPLVHLTQTKRLTLEATPEGNVRNAPDMTPLANVKVAHLTLVGCFRNAETTRLDVGAVETRDYVCLIDGY